MLRARGSEAPVLPLSHPALMNISDTAKAYRHERCHDDRRPRGLVCGAVAKRSVKKARAREAQDPDRSRSAAGTVSSSAPSRGFWLGALVATAVLVPLAVVAVLLLGDGDERSSGSAASQSAADPEQSEADRLRREAAVRDKEQIEDLTQRARSMVDDFAPVIVGLARTLPPDSDRIGPVASARTVSDWRGRVQEADEYFADTVSGETATNVARNGLGSAVAVLLEAVETYQLALENPSVRGALFERARSQRDLAARAWSAAATQLDAINIDAGFGHQHVVFPSSAGSGALPPDDLPEGTDAASGGG